MIPSVTIGWFPRERFAIAGESLQSLLDNTPDCPLVIVDPATPQRFMTEIHRVLGKRKAEIVSTGRPVLPAESKNLVLDRVKTDYVALVENDVLFLPYWLEALVSACEEVPADAAAPLIFDGRVRKEHFDKHLGEIRASATQPGKREVGPLVKKRNSASGREKVQFVEQHCVVYRMSTFDRIGRFDEELNTRDEVDLSIALHDAGCNVVLEPASQIHYVPPTWRPEEDELPFYRNRWDLARAERSRDRIRDRWGLVDTPGDLGFVKYRNLITRMPEVRRDIATLSSVAGETVLLEGGNWIGTDITEGLSVMPFPNCKGYFGGFPVSDLAAVDELDKVIAAGAKRIVVGYPVFWWFDYLPKFRSRLSETCRTVRADDLLQVFEVSR